MLPASFRKAAETFSASLAERRWEWRVLAWLAGILLYLTLAEEPAIGSGIFALLALLLLAAGMGRRLSAAWLGGMLLAGFAYSQWFSQNLPPPFPGAAAEYWLEGDLLEIQERQDKRVRLLLGDVRLEEGPALAGRVRISARSGAVRYLEEGDRLRLKAMLYPPAPPPLPGAFDLARYLYFQQVTATGFVLSGIENLPGDQEPEPWTGGRFHNAARHWVRDLLNTRLSPESATVARALILGEQQVVSDDLADAYRRSGLTHLLSISGLHMAMVAWLAFVLMRRLLCLSGWVALHWPTRKLAALAAWLLSGGYLWLADAPVAAQRAWLMTALVCLAILLGRSVTSLRLLSMAALTVSLFNPGAVLTAGFQLSFLAVFALMVAYRRRKDDALSDISWLNRLYQLPGTFGRLVFCSVLIVVMTAPVTLHHFSQLSWMSVFSNLLAIPMTNLLLMPGLLAALLLSPLGILSEPCFRLSDIAIAALNRWAEVCADYAAVWLPSFPPLEGWTVALLIGLLVTAGLLRRAVPWGVALLALATVGFWGRWQPPVWIADGDFIAWKGREGWGLYAHGERPEPGFVQELWRQRLGEGQWSTEPAPCDALACRWQAGTDAVELILHPDALPEACRHSSLLFLSDLPEFPCTAKVMPLQGEMLALWPDGRLRRAADLLGTRPWYGLNPAYRGFAAFATRGSGTPGGKSPR